MIQERSRLGDLLKNELPAGLSRETAILATGRKLSLGAVLGRALLSCPTSGTPGTNTGNGTLTGVVPGPATRIGTYVLTCVQTAEDGGVFQVRTPDGTSLPDAAVGAAYVNPQLSFSLNAGTADFAAGDSFTLTVAAGSGLVTAVDASATDGRQQAWGVLLHDADATTGATRITAAVRLAVLDRAVLVWPQTATDNQKSAWLDELQLQAVSAREGF